MESLIQSVPKGWKFKLGDRIIFKGSTSSEEVIGSSSEGECYAILYKSGWYFHNQSFIEDNYSLVSDSSSTNDDLNDDLVEKIESATPDYRKLISEECDNLKALLLEKNDSYGNSFANPMRVFSRADAEEQLLVRCDDKLSRIARGKEFQGDDTLKDLIGYLILLRCLRRSK